MNFHSLRLFRWRILYWILLHYLLDWLRFELLDVESQELGEKGVATAYSRRELVSLELQVYFNSAEFVPVFVSISF